MDICRKFGIEAVICKDLSEIRNQKFDFIFALDVLEHVEVLDIYIDKFLELSHCATNIVISGPTENLLYKAGRILAGFSGHNHLRNIYDIENKLRGKGLKNKTTKNIYFPVTLFRVSLWGK